METATTFENPLPSGMVLSPARSLCGFLRRASSFLDGGLGSIPSEAGARQMVYGCTLSSSLRGDDRSTPSRFTYRTEWFKRGGMAVPVKSISSGRKRRAASFWKHIHGSTVDRLEVQVRFLVGVFPLPRAYRSTVTARRFRFDSGCARGPSSLQEDACCRTLIRPRPPQRILVHPGQKWGWKSSSFSTPERPNVQRPILPLDTIGRSGLHRAVCKQPPKEAAWAALFVLPTLTPATGSKP